MFMTLAASRRRRLGGGATPVTATHMLTVGASGTGAFGFFKGFYGTIDPPTLDGLVIQSLFAGADILRLSLAGGEQIAGADTVNIFGAAPGAQVITLTWNVAEDAYVSPVVTGLDAWLEGRVGDDIPINVLANVVITPEVALKALLAGRNGYAIDPRDQATLFQDDAATIPVTAPTQPVGCVLTKFGSTLYHFRQAAAAAQPTYQIGRVVPDGVDDMLDMGAEATPLFANVIDGYVVCMKLGGKPALTPGSIHGAGQLGNAASRVYDITIAANGAVTFWARVPTLTSFSSAAGVWRADTPLLLTMDVNYLTKRVRGFANGVKVVDTAAPSSLPRANTVNRHRLFSTSTDGAARTNLSLLRACFLHDAADDSEIETIEDWVGEF
jgi:hypothetical protein